MNLYDQDEHYQLSNEVVECLEQWPTASSAQKEHAASIEVAKQAFYAAGSCYWSEYLPDGQRDMRWFDLYLRYRLLDRHPATAGHAAQARAELAALVQHRREAMIH